MFPTSNASDFYDTFSPVLAIDTAGETAGVMLSTDSVYDRYFPAKQATEHLLPSIRELLAQVAINVEALRAIVWNAGPGSFTGLRIAAGIVQGLSVAHAIPVIAVPCFDGWLRARIWHNALPHFEPSSILCVLDARAGEVYWCGFSQSPTSFMHEHPNIGKAIHGYYPEGPIRVERPPSLIEALSRLNDKKTYSLGLGGGFARYPELYPCVDNDNAVLTTLSTPNDLALHLQALIAIAKDLLHQTPTPIMATSTHDTLRTDLPLYVRHKVALTVSEQHIKNTEQKM